MTDKITVDIADQPYDIHVGDGILDRAGEYIAPHLNRPRTVIVSDENVAIAQLPRLEKALNNASITYDVIILPAGEATKSFARLEKLLDDLLVLGLERKDKIIALGGGVIGDITGFAASIYQRGIGYIQIPTTLLAQVDSSVGGKCAINSLRGKNLIGSFHQPDLVLADVSSLGSLPERQLLAGYAEMVKYGLIANEGFFCWLEENGRKIIAGDPAAQIEAILVCVREKAQIVAEDEKETGQRALLNLGHTFGHALEAHCGYGDKLLHGEAVAMGMGMAFDLSAKMGLCKKGEADRVRRHLENMALPVYIPASLQDKMTAESLYNHTLLDKKMSGGQVTYVLVRAIGEAFLTPDVMPDDVQAAFRAALGSEPE